MSYAWDFVVISGGLLRSFNFFCDWIHGVVVTVFVSGGACGYAERRWMMNFSVLSLRKMSFSGFLLDLKRCFAQQAGDSKPWSSYQHWSSWSFTTFQRCSSSHRCWWRVASG